MCEGVCREVVHMRGDVRGACVDSADVHVYGSRKDDVME